MRALKTTYKRRFALFLVIALCLGSPQLMSLAGGEQKSDLAVEESEGRNEGDLTDLSETGNSEVPGGDDLDADSDSAQAASKDTKSPEPESPGDGIEEAESEEPAGEMPEETEAVSDDTAGDRPKEADPDPEVVVIMPQAKMPTPSEDLGFQTTPSETGSDFQTYTQQDESGNVIATWTVTEKTDDVTGEITYEIFSTNETVEDMEPQAPTEEEGYVCVKDAEGRDVYTKVDENGSTYTWVMEKIEGEDGARYVVRTTATTTAVPEAYTPDVKDWLIEGEDGTIEAGDGVTVTMTPGTTDRVDVTVNVPNLVDVSISDVTPARPENAETIDNGYRFTDPEGTATTVTESRDADGNTVISIAAVTQDGQETTTIITEVKGVGYTRTETQPDGREIQTIVTGVKDSDGNLVGRTVTTIETIKKSAEVDRKEEIVGREESEPKEKTEITLPELPEGYKPGEEIEDVDEEGKPITVAVDEMYDVDEEDNPVYDADGNRVVIGYRITVRDEEGNVISTESMTGTKTTTREIEVTETIKITVTDEILITRAMSVEGIYVFRVVDETGGQHCGVWGKLSGVESVEGSHDDNPTTESMKPDFKNLENGIAPGETNFNRDLVNRNTKLEAYTMNSTSRIRNDAGEPIEEMLEAGMEILVSEKKVLEDGSVLGKIGENRWVELAKADGKYVAEPGKFYFAGENGLESAIRIDLDKSSPNYGTYSDTWKAHQFIVYDSNGVRHYVYCADFAVDPKANTSYGKTEVEDTKDYWVKDDEAANKEIARKVQAIVMNGYWGTATGPGSLESIRAMLKNADLGAILGKLDIEADKLDAVLGALNDGVALSATQAAIWNYATSGKQINKDDPFGRYCVGLNPDGTGIFADKEVYTEYFSENEQKAARLLYEYLRNLGGEEGEAVRKIQESSVTEASITVKSIVTDEKGNYVIADPKKDGLNVEDDPANTNYKYNTDISFVLDVRPSEINDDLIVQIFDANGNLVAYSRVCGEEKGRADQVSNKKENECVWDKESGKWKCTIKDVELFENTSITLNLSGNHVIKEAYLLTATNEGNYNSQMSQTFISAESGNQKVDLNINLTFNVREPSVESGKAQAAMEDSLTYRREEVSYREDVSHETVTDSDEGTGGTESTPTPTPPGGETPPPEEPPTDPTDPADPDIPDEPTPLSEEPGEEIPDEPVPLTEIPVTVELSDEVLTAELPDEPVPLAAVPVMVELPDELTELPDEDVPLAGGPELVDLFDEDVPLAGVPETGDISAAWYVLILSAGCCLMALRIAHAARKRR